MATGGGDAQLFEDNFTIYERDQSKYDRVARITASTEDNLTQMTLDVNIELFPVAIGDRLTVVLATSLSLDGTRDSVSDGKGWRDVKGESSLADLYDYVCHGKIYKFEDGADGQTLKAYISYGGLLMMLEGPSKKLLPLRVENTYLLIKK
ncbi:DNA-directed RNA polymerases I-II-and III subunit [Apiospora rasikravindrae]|uniref:DNA-directed RNA polymerases I, II, and III subunit RPABC3 n=1 Tax=Apiospora rasikravindrae TaxID=990691 RepID=A0ABR1U243_9PEZI